MPKKHTPLVLSEVSSQQVSLAGKTVEGVIQELKQKGGSVVHGVISEKMRPNCPSGATGIIRYVGAPKGTHYVDIARNLKGAGYRAATAFETLTAFAESDLRCSKEVVSLERFAVEFDEPVLLHCYAQWSGDSYVKVYPATNQADYEPQISYEDTVIAVVALAS